MILEIRVGSIAAKVTTIWEPPKAFLSLFKSCVSFLLPSLISYVL